MYKERARDDEDEEEEPKSVVNTAPMDGKVNFLTSLSEVSKSQLPDTCLVSEDKYDLSLFVNPVTRRQTFQLLFDEVGTLNAKTEKLRAGFYDVKGCFLRDKYEAQDEIRVQRKQLNEYCLWTRKLASVVDDVARSYNDDLLNYFPLH